MYIEILDSGGLQPYNGPKKLVLGVGIPEEQAALLLGQDLPADAPKEDEPWAQGAPFDVSILMDL